MDTYKHTRFLAQLDNELSIKRVGGLSASASDSSSGYTFHPRYGYKEKQPKKPRPSQADAQSPRVSVTVNKTVMDELGREIGTVRVGNFLQVLLKDWILEKMKERNGQ